MRALGPVITHPVGAAADFPPAVSIGVVTVVLVLAAAAYLRGLYVLGGTGAHPWQLGARRQGIVRTLAFFGGLLAIAVALLPPVDDLAGESFTGHMVQHMLLIVVAAPLLAAGAPGLLMVLVLPRRWRLPVNRMRWSAVNASLLRPLGWPVTAWAFSVAALWGWHMPAAYDAGLRSAPVHALEHLTLLATAWWYWWHLFSPSARRLRGGLAVLYVFVAMAPMAALGAILTFAQQPLYPAQAAVSAAHGVAALRDQQLAGLTMWIPADVLYLAVAVVLFEWWLHRLELAGSTGRTPAGEVLLPPGEAGR